MSFYSFCSCFSLIYVVLIEFSGYNSSLKSNELNKLCLVKGCWAGTGEEGWRGGSSWVSVWEEVER